MSERKPTFAGRYVRLVLAGLALGGLAALVGYAPTLKIAGKTGVSAMYAGISAAVVAGWLGGIVACQTGGSGPERINRLLGATALRMFAAVGLALALVFATELSKKPLVLWVALAYLITLAGETALLVRWTRQDESRNDSNAVESISPDKAAGNGKRK
ncbi:MAG TPA: hypothetical protein PKN33_00315 [Phycisphaerae bacterium]|nr:hypothetical protein [Phycisphaerae bacterium]